MPIYTFHCGKCEADHEILMNISEYTNNQKCPDCKKLMNRNFTAERVYGYISDEPKTVGSLAEKNSKNRGII